MATRKKRSPGKKAPKKEIPKAPPDPAPPPEAPASSEVPAPSDAPEPSETPASSEIPAPSDAPEPSEASAPAEPSEPPVRFEREPATLSPETEKALRTHLKRGRKALEAVRETLMAFEPPPGDAVTKALDCLAEELDALAPPEPRKCKEYKRAIALARKGEMGIHPDDVMKYCRCGECQALREKAGLAHPPTPRAV